MSNRAFKRALYWSAGAHLALLLLFIVNPSLPKSGPKGQILFVNLGSMGGGGGNGGSGGGMRGPAGGGATETVAETPLPKPQLRDLTTAQKVQADAGSELRYPTSKTKPARKKPVPEKKAASLNRPDPNAKTGKTPADKTAGTTGTSTGRTGGGGGTGLTIGGGAPGYGEGAGLGGYGGMIGESNFPYQYYLQNIQDRISGRWRESLVDPGVTGNFRTTVYFRIFRNGTISRVEVKEPSGLRPLDLSSQRAVTDAAPFPPLPDDYDEEYLGIILIFEYIK
ncbi:MAG: energy transducer TonB [Candidatus Aminicenantes bacterium]|nr:energy transducer TonB [Candidatus Aminicenantes bacterium]